MRVVPFRAVRPTRDKVQLVATRSYVNYPPAQLRRKLTENPYCFLHIIHPDMTATKMHSTHNAEERFALVRKNYEHFCEEQILQKESAPAFYVYRQTKEGHAFTGIVGAVSVEDYLNGKIKIHEQTLSNREDTFVKYLEVTEINAEPVLLMSKKSDAVETVISRYERKRPEYEFTTADRVSHEVWVVNIEEDIKIIGDAYKKINAFYIADGHHRSSSSARLFEKKKQKSHTGKEPWNYCLAYILNEANVQIHEFNRVVKDLGKLSIELFLKKLDKDFVVNQAEDNYKPTVKGEFSMYIDKRWYSLKLRSPNEDLDTQLLSDLILSPILGIHDLRKDKRISFMEGPKGMDALKKAVNKNKDGVAFGLFPMSVEEVKRIADNHLTMPPKSTWVEPKLRSGLLVYELDNL